MNAARFRTLVQPCMIVVAMLLWPASSEAETITVCAVPEGDENRYMDVTVSAEMNGLPLDISTQQLTTGCVRVTLDQCTEAVIINVATEVTHRGVARCQPSPPALKIAMQTLRWDFIARAFGRHGSEQARQIGFDITGFEAEIAKASIALADMPPDARVANQALREALGRGDYATAQSKASEVATYLRLADEERLSLAYSSITYVAGFKAMGVDPLAPENPLVTVVGSPQSSFLVLSPEGRNVLQLYQQKRAIRARPGVWDYRTTATVSDIEKVAEDVQTFAVPPGLESGRLGIDRAGRLQLR